MLFESPLAAGLLGAYVQATSGGALYRKSSFLLDSLGKRCFPSTSTSARIRTCRAARAARRSTTRACARGRRDVVDGGVVESYFLSSYSARKLGMKTTGHAGGSHNLTLTSRLTRPGDDLEAMLRKLGRGLFVTELMGQGVNYVTGDYSRGAAGFWVEGGKIALPGARDHHRRQPARDVRRRIVAVGADAYTMGSKTIGSVLIERMKIAGA